MPSKVDSGMGQAITVMAFDYGLRRVGVAVGNASMEIPRTLLGAEMDGAGRRVAILCAEVLPVRLKFGGNGRVGAQPDVQFLERVVVDQMKRDVFVAPALPRLGVRGALRGAGGGQVAYVAHAGFHHEILA